MKSKKMFKLHQWIFPSLDTGEPSSYRDLSKLTQNIPAGYVRSQSQTSFSGKMIKLSLFSIG